MMILFRNVSGLTIQGNFSNDDRVSNAAQYLSEKLNIPQSSIRFITKQNSLFCSDSSELSKIVEKGTATFIIFPDMSLTCLDEKLENPAIHFKKSSINDEDHINSDENQNFSPPPRIGKNSSRFTEVPPSRYHSYFLRHQNAIKNLNSDNGDKKRLKLKHDLSDSFIHLINENRFEASSSSSRKYAPYSSNHSLFKDYNRTINSTPRDLDYKIAQLHQMGFDPEDCKEALRACRYDVERASEYIVGMNKSHRGLFSRFDSGYIPYDDDGFNFIEMREHMLFERRMRERRLRRANNDSNLSDDDEDFSPRPFSPSDFFLSRHGLPPSFLRPFYRLLPMIISDLRPSRDGVDNRVLINILRILLMDSRGGRTNPIANHLITAIRQRKMMENDLFEEEEDHEQEEKKDHKKDRKRGDIKSKSSNDEISLEEEDDDDFFNMSGDDGPIDPIRLLMMYERSKAEYDGNRRRRISSEVMELVNRFEDNYDDDDIEFDLISPTFTRPNYSHQNKHKQSDLNPNKGKQVHIEIKSKKSSPPKNQTRNDTKLDLSYSFLFDSETDLQDQGQDIKEETPSERHKRHKKTKVKFESIRIEKRKSDQIQIEKSSSEPILDKEKEKIKKTDGQENDNLPPPPPPSKNKYPPPPQLSSSKKKASTKREKRSNDRLNRRDISNDDMAFLNEFAQTHSMPLEIVIDAFQQTGNNRQTLQEFFS